MNPAHYAMYGSFLLGLSFGMAIGLLVGLLA